MAVSGPPLTSYPSPMLRSKAQSLTLPSAILICFSPRSLSNTGICQGWQMNSPLPRASFPQWRSNHVRHADFFLNEDKSPVCVKIKEIIIIFITLIFCFNSAVVSFYRASVSRSRSRVRALQHGVLVRIFNPWDEEVSTKSLGEF